MITKVRKIKKGTRGKKLFFPILVAVLVLLVIGFLIKTNLKIKQRRAKLTAQIEVLQEEIQSLEEKNQELKQGISQAGSEEYLERVAREELGLKAPGEEVVVISMEGEEEEKEVEEEKKTWWEWLKGILKH